jgi:hypothetical protein
LKHPTTDQAVAYQRPVGIAAVLALALLMGALLVFATANKATAAPDGPERVFALTENDSLLRFDGDTPRDTQRMRITGLNPGSSLVGIDFRPSAQAPAAAQQGKLYGVSDDGFIYTINPGTGEATQGPQLTANGVPVVLLGTSFGIDFNPTVDRLRIVSDQDQNLRANVDTGATTVDGPLQYAAGDPNAGQNPSVGSVAYRNSQPAAFGTTNTELYDIDSQTDDFAEQDPPNNGTLVTEGELGRNIQEPSGFDIVTNGDSPAGDRGFAALKPMRSESTFFYRVNLENGNTAMIGRIASRGTTVEGIAIRINQQ